LCRIESAAAEKVAQNARITPMSTTRISRIESLGHFTIVASEFGGRTGP